MRKLLLTILALAALFVPAQAFAQKPKLSAAITSCTTGAAPLDRALKVTATMPKLPGSDTMGMRFDLYQQTGSASGPFKKVKLPAWAPWVRSEPGRPGYVFERLVDSLVTPARYRVVVRFRWYDADGARIKTKTKATKVCKQTEPAATVAPVQ